MSFDASCARASFASAMAKLPIEDARGELRQLFLDMLDVFEQTDDEAAVQAAMNAYEARLRATHAR